MSSRPRIKICGFTRAADLRSACELGVDLVGLNLARGPRRISVARAADLRLSVSVFTQVVALFVDAPAQQVLSDARACGAHVVQLHGHESPETVAQLARRIPVIKAMRIAAATDIQRAHDYAAAGARALLLDAYHPQLLGGSGQAWDYRLLQGARFTCPVLIAGGLGPANAVAALAATGADGIDVASGVESSPGCKNPRKMQALVDAVRETEQ